MFVFIHIKYGEAFRLRILSEGMQAFLEWALSI